MKDEKELSRSKKCATKVLFSALTILSKNGGGEKPLRELMEKVGHDVAFTPWEIERLETTGAIRWQSILNFYSIDCVKAGFFNEEKRCMVPHRRRRRRYKTGACRIV